MAEGILHCNGVRMRINGTGSLRMTLRSLNDVKTSALRPFVMQELTNIEPSRLANFKSQRISLRMYTSDLGDEFIINRVIVFVKSIYEQYPSSQNGNA